MIVLGIFTLTEMTVSYLYGRWFLKRMGDSYRNFACTGAETSFLLFSVVLAVVCGWDLERQETCGCTVWESENKIYGLNSCPLNSPQCWGGSSLLFLALVRNSTSRVEPVALQEHPVCNLSFRAPWFFMANYTLESAAAPRTHPELSLHHLSTYPNSSLNLFEILPELIRSGYSHLHSGLAIPYSGIGSSSRDEETLGGSCSFAASWEVFSSGSYCCVFVVQAASSTYSRHQSRFGLGFLSLARC